MSKLVANPEIKESYDKIRDDKDPMNWVLLEYIDDKTDELKVSASGTGGIKEFISNCKQDQAGFGFIRVNASNDPLSQRTKFVFVTWCGSKVKVMRKAKLSIHISQVKTIFKSFAVEINATIPEDLEESTVMLAVTKAMGANYDRQASNY